MLYAWPACIMPTGASMGQQDATMLQQAHLRGPDAGCCLKHDLPALTGLIQLPVGLAH